MTTPTATRLLVTMTGIAGIFELTSIPFVNQPLGSLTAGLAFLGAAAWLKRGRGLTAPAILAVLFLVELSGEPFYERHTLSDWILQASLGLLSLAGLGASAVLVHSRFRARRTTPGTT